MSETLLSRRFVGSLMAVAIGTTACGYQQVDSMENIAATQQEIEPKAVELAQKILSLPANPDFVKSEDTISPGGKVYVFTPEDRKNLSYVNYTVSSSPDSEDVTISGTSCVGVEDFTVASLDVYALMGKDAAGKPDPKKVTTISLTSGYCRDGFAYTDRVTLSNDAFMKTYPYKHIEGLWNSEVDTDTNDPVEVAKNEAHKEDLDMPLSTDILNFNSVDFSVDKAKEINQRNISRLTETIDKISTVKKEEIANDAF